MTNIFLTHNPFHVYMVQHIIKSGLLASGAINIVLLEYETDCSHLIDHALWSQVIGLEIIGKSTVGHERYERCENNVKRIKSLIGDDKDAQIFMSDIAWPMNNRVYFDKQLKARADFCLFSDGLGTYLQPRVTPALYLRGLVKTLNGFIKQGVPYKNYTGNPFGIDRKETKHVYAPNAALIGCEDSKKKEVIFSSVVEKPLNASKCLFLDSPGLLGMGKSQWHSVRSSALDLLKSLGFREYYYKNHPMGRVEDARFYGLHGFNIIDDCKCAEQVVDENDFGVVVSYNSSAIFNLKCIYKDQLRCISLFSHALSKATGYNDNKAKETLDLYKKVNVEIVMLP